MEKMIDCDQPEDYMGISGPLVTVYEQLLSLYRAQDMREEDWYRGDDLCKLDGTPPTDENIIKRIQQTRFACLYEIEGRLTEVNPLTYPKPYV